MIYEVKKYNFSTRSYEELREFLIPHEVLLPKEDNLQNGLHIFCDFWDTEDFCILKSQEDL
jgi:hypothetical protein